MFLLPSLARLRAILLTALLLNPSITSLDAFHFHAPAITKSSVQRPRSYAQPPSVLRSTPFDLDMYDNALDDDDDDDDDSNKMPSLLDTNTKLVLGINKYSHDTTLCAADAATGNVLFALSKERITRKKHDGGNTANLVELCLEELNLDVDNIVRVVMNNHHHRILPFIEANANHMEWEEGLGINGGMEIGYSDEFNLLHSVEDKLELSHHLAHAYSAAAQCPFDTGLIVVMDGMGETYRTMMRAKESKDATYVSDFNLCDGGIDESIQFIPSDITERAKTSYFDWREAESVYTFCKDGRRSLNIKPVFKRFTEEKTPPTLYNHGFENMDSLGAVYSRASSHIFGDWNACGKVMGLAPWQGHVWDSDGKKITASTIDEPILQGRLYDEKDGGLTINKSQMMGMPFIARVDPDMFDNEGNMIRTKRYDFDDNDYVPPKSSDNTDNISEEMETLSKQLPLKVALDAIGLASRIQSDLETVAMDFVEHFKKETGEVNLCLAGGVALNSVLNGRLSRKLGFENTFIPPYPGDDGVAIGCCAFGLFGRIDPPSTAQDTICPLLWNETLSPYLGPMPTTSDMKDAVEWAEPWLEVEIISDESKRNDVIVEELVSGGVVAIYSGRSELGPRALGHRSILADPRKKGLVRFINEFVKKRESFRPFAPSCLAEEAADWFEVDGTARLQTITSSAEPRYHRLISAFFKATGIPMVLNTSFNTLKSEPIVETPQNAIRSFLSSMGTIEMLVMGDYVLKRKVANIRTLLGEEQSNGMMTPPSFPTRPGSVNYKTTFSAGMSGDYDNSLGSKTLVQMLDRPMHNEMDGGWFELLDDLEGQLLGMCDGTMGVNEIMTQFTSMNEDACYDKITEDEQLLLENIIQRLARLYEHTLLSW